MPGNIGLQEIVIVLIIALIIFGPKRLPELGRSLGKGIREFRGSIGGDGHQDERPEAIEPPPPRDREGAKGDREGESVAHDRG